MKKQLPLLGMVGVVMLVGAGCTASDLSTLIQLISLISNFL
jgi:hypothetical protein